MEAPEVGEAAARTLQRRRSMSAVLALAGIVGPILFAVVALVHSLLREDHSLVALPISAHWRRGQAAGCRTLTSSSVDFCSSHTRLGFISRCARRDRAWSGLRCWCLAGQGSCLPASSQP